MTNINGTRDRIVNTDPSGGGGGGGGSVTQATTPWTVDDPNTQSALATILTELGNILTQLQATLTVAVSGEVEVKNDAGNTLGITGSVGVTNFPPDYPDALAEASLSIVEKKFIPSDGSPATVSSSGNTTVYTPALGNRIRLLWVGLSTPEANGAEVLVKVYIGATELYRWNMGKPGAFAHGMVREGAANEALIVNLSTNQPVYVNFDLEEVA